MGMIPKLTTPPTFLVCDQLSIHRIALGLIAMILFTLRSILVLEHRLISSISGEFIPIKSTRSSSLISELSEIDELFNLMDKVIKNSSIE